jgi:hypothetical protein
LIGARPSRLWAAAAAFVAGFVGLMCVWDYGARWDWQTMEYTGLWTPVGFVRYLFYDGLRAVFPWAGLLIFGMWVGRVDLRRPGRWRGCSGGARPSRRPPNCPLPCWSRSPRTGRFT